MVLNGHYETLYEAQWELLKFEFIGALMVLLRNLSLAVFFQDDYDKKPTAFLIEFVTLIFPLLFGLTTLSHVLDSWILVMVSVCIALAVIQVFRDKPLYYLVRKTDYLSGFRNSLLVGTAVAILACDFDIFPHRYHKTTTYGASVMDLGTAAFVLVMAMSEFVVNNRPNARPRRHQRFNDLVVVFVLLGLGTFRILSTELLDYSVATIEYGQHWNFYFTLGFLKLFSTIFPYPYSIPVGIIFGISYQTALSHHGLEAWVMRDDRDTSNLFDANREGICSLFGYIFEYSLILLFAKLISLFDGVFNPSYRSAFSWIGFGLLAYGSQLALMNFLDLGLPSRRIANIPYVLAMLYPKSIDMGLFQLIQMQGVIRSNVDNSKAINLLEAISGNSLTFFLLSNFGTGLVNVIINTHHVRSTLDQIGILFAYNFGNCLVIYLWHWYSNKDKKGSQTSTPSPIKTDKFNV